jgi:predicted nucleotidyltransferase
MALAKRGMVFLYKLIKVEMPYAQPLDGFMIMQELVKIDIVPSTVPEDMREDLQRAIRILRKGGCSEIYLFGSAASGETRADSDLDIAVRGCPQGRFFRLLGQLCWELNHTVDLVNLDTQDLFAKYLLQEEALIRIG